MTRKSLLAASVAFTLTTFTASAHAAVCERGYVAEIIDSARSSAPGGDSYPRILFRTDQTGFNPLPGNLRKAEINGQSYSVLALAKGSDEFERLAFEAKLQALKAAFLARTPIRVYSFDDFNCAPAASNLEVLVCTSETSCDI